MNYLSDAFRSIGEAGETNYTPPVLKANDKKLTQAKSCTDSKTQATGEEIFKGRKRLPVCRLQPAIKIRDKSALSANKSQSQEKINAFIQEKHKADIEKDFDALQNLADMYKNGIGTNASEENAFKYLKKSADGGNGTAQHQVANMYRDGKGTTKSLQNAYRYYDYAIAQKIEDAIIDRDAMISKLHRNYLALTTKQTPLAMCKLAKIHQIMAGSCDSAGKLIPKGYHSIAALELLDAASHKYDCREAQFQLAQIYETSSFSYIQAEAFKLFEIAASKGHIEAKKILASK